jgi:hypothetical protein
MKNSKSFQTSSMICLIAGLFLLSSAVTSAQKTNFAGSWVFSTEKSIIPENGFGGATKMMVTQDDLALSMERTFKGRDGEDITAKEKITLDGKECENVVFGDFKKKSVASWSADGKILTINGVMVFNMNGENMEMKSVEIWKLSDDASTLTQESSFSTPNGDMKSTNVYVKTK